MIRVTDSAAAQLRDLLQGKEAGTGLRLMVEKGGCAGLQYAMKLESPEEGDDVVEKDGIFVYVEAASRDFLNNCEVDYVETLADTGFKIHNPNAVRSCGCGSSFEPAAAGTVSTDVPSPDSRDAAA